MVIPCKKCRHSEWYNWSPSLIHIKLHKPMVFGRGLPLFGITQWGCLIWTGDGNPLGTQGTAMIMDEEASLLKRSWCLFELLQTVRTCFLTLRDGGDPNDAFTALRCLKFGCYIELVVTLSAKKRCYYDLLLDQALVDGFYWEFLKFDAICYMVGYLDHLLRLSGIQCRGSGLRQESLDSFDGFGWVLHVSILKLDPIMHHRQTF